MKDRSKLQGQSLRLVAAAVLLALGSPLAAQQPAQQPGQQPGQQTEQQQPQTEQQRDDELGQQRQDDPFAQDEREQDDPFAEDERDDPFAQDERDRDIDVAAADREPGVRGEGLEQLTQQHDNLSTFVEAVKAAGMEEALTDGRTSYTIFAPTNEAFEQMDHERLLQSENWEETAELLRAHIVADDVDREMVRRIPQALTLDGGTIELMEQDGELMADNARVVEEDIQVGNLRVYAIDSVLQASPGEVDIATRDDQWEDDDFQDRTQDDPFGDRDDDFGAPQQDDDLGQPRDEGFGEPRDEGFGDQPRDDDLGRDRGVDDDDFGADDRGIN